MVLVVFLVHEMTKASVEIAGGFSEMMVYQEDASISAGTILGGVLLNSAAVVGTLEAELQPVRGEAHLALGGAGCRGDGDGAAMAAEAMAAEVGEVESTAGEREAEEREGETAMAGVGDELRAADAIAAAGSRMASPAAADAFEVFERYISWSEARSRADLLTCSLLVKVCVESDDLDAALAVYAKLREAGAPTDKQTCAGALEPSRAASASASATPALHTHPLWQLARGTVPLASPTPELGAWLMACAGLPFALRAGPFS